MLHLFIALTNVLWSLGDENLYSILAFVNIKGDVIYGVDHHNFMVVYANSVRCQILDYLHLYACHGQVEKQSFLDE